MNRFLHPLITRKGRRLLWCLVVLIMVPFTLFISSVSIKEMRTMTAIMNTTMGTRQFWSENGPNKANESMEHFNQNLTNGGLPWKSDNISSTALINTVPFKWCNQYSPNQTEPLTNNDSEPNCDELFSGCHETIEQAKSWKPPCAYSDQDMAEISCNCQQLQSLFYFEPKSLSEEEANYPLAFIMVVEKHSEQVIRLLASIYQPQNLFCITYDEHSNKYFKRSIQCLTKCFKNVIMPQKHMEIYWGDISILDATMNCLKLLTDSAHDWKYVQFLSWNDLPLRTNAEMVKILKILNGTPDCELGHGQPERYRKHHIHGEEDTEKTHVPRSIPPNGVIMYKGSFAVSLPRSLCHYLITDQEAQMILDWSRPTWAPEEQFFATIIHNIHLKHNSTFPGSCLQYYDYENKQKQWISRFQIWNEERCDGKLTFGSCVFGVGDLKNMKARQELMAHKFYSDFEPAAWYCMLKWNHEKTYCQTSEKSLNFDYYQTLPSVVYHKMINKTDFTC